MKWLYLNVQVPTMVDDKFEQRLMNYVFQLNEDNGYLRCSTPGKYRGVYLHKMIAEWLGLDTSMEIDHEDRNKLNNQESNLREATHAQNQANAGRRVNNISGHKGIGYNKKRGKWIVRINHEGKSLYFGGYSDYEEACIVHEREFTRLKGEFAFTG